MSVRAETAARVERELRADIRWAVRNRKWNPYSGAYCDLDGTWRGEGRCGVCAIGAHVVRHQPKTVSGAWSLDVEAAAKSLRAPSNFIEEIYGAVMETKDERYYITAASVGQKLGWRLRDYADRYRKQLKKRGAK